MRLQSRSGEKMQPTTQVVGTNWGLSEPRRGERHATTQTPEGRLNSRAKPSIDELSRMNVFYSLQNPNAASRRLPKLRSPCKYRFSRSVGRGYFTVERVLRIPNNFLKTEFRRSCRLILQAPAKVPAERFPLVRPSCQDSPPGLLSRETPAPFPLSS